MERKRETSVELKPFVLLSSKNILGLNQLFSIKFMLFLRSHYFQVLIRSRVLVILISVRLPILTCKTLLEHTRHTAIQMVVGKEGQLGSFFINNATSSWDFFFFLSLECSCKSMWTLHVQNHDCLLSLLGLFREKKRYCNVHSWLIQRITDCNAHELILVIQSIWELHKCLPRQGASEKLECFSYLIIF